MEKRNFNVKIGILTAIVTTVLMILPQISVPSSAQEPEEYFFTLHLVCPYIGPGAEYDKSMQLKADLAEIGINVEVHFMEKAEYYPRVWGLSFNKTWDEGGWDMDIGRFSWRQTGAMWFEGCWASVGFPPYGWDYFGWKNGIADLALKKGWTTTDWDERMKCYETFLWQFYLDPPAMAEYWPLMPLPVSTRFDLKASAMKMGMSEEDFEKMPYAVAGMGGYEVLWAPYWVFKAPAGEKRILVTAQGCDPPHILPLFHSSGDDFNTGMSEPLVVSGYDPIGHKMVCTPWLAERWEWSEDSLALTFYLRDNVYWQDGVKITAEDVAWTIDTIIDPATKAAARGDYASLIKSTEVIDETTVTLHLYAPSPDLTTVLLGPWEGAICPKHILEDVPRSELMSHWMNIEGPSAAHPDYVGNGPFKLVEWKKNEYMRFEAWPDWWGWEEFGDGEPTVDEVVVEIIPDASVALAALEAGDIDMMQDYLVLPMAAEVPDVAERSPDVNSYEYAMQCIRFIGFNLFHPQLNNVFVRRAICHAHNNQRVIDEILLGWGIPATGPIPDTHSLYPPNPPPTWEYNVELAKQYMEMAGYKYEYLEPPPEVTIPMSAYLYPAIGGIIVGLIVGLVAGRSTKR